MHVLDNLATGTVRCVFSHVPLRTTESLLAWGSICPEGEGIAICEVNLSRPVYEMIDDMVCSLARVALIVWPDWYDSPELSQHSDESSLQSVLDRLASSCIASRHRTIHRPWVLHAVAMCRSNVPPVISEFAPALQLQQLSLAIASNDLILVVRALPEKLPESAGLSALARNLEWLARQVSARVIAVLPAAWSGSAELDGISWELRTVDEAESSSPEAEISLEEKTSSLVSPIRGRPHPNSPGEQLSAIRCWGHSSSTTWQ